MTVAGGVASSGAPFAVDATSVYVGDVGTLKLIPRAGGPPEIFALTDGFAITSVAVDASAVYYVLNRRAGGPVLQSVPIGGGVATTLSTGVVTGPLTLDATHVYWVKASGLLVKVPKGGGGEETLASDLPELSDLVAVMGRSSSPRRRAVSYRRSRVVAAPLLPRPARNLGGGDLPGRRRPGDSYRRGRHRGMA